jgi:DHA1 family multidrug resistance protein-like MFS transporter
MYAASALAANTVCRSACGAAAPLFTLYMFDALGVGGGGSLIAGVACLLAPIPFVFYRYGEPIRRRSKFAPTEDEGAKKKGGEGKGGRDEEEVGASRNTGSESSGESSSTVGDGETEKKEDEEGGGDFTRQDGVDRDLEKDLEKEM